MENFGTAWVKGKPKARVLGLAAHAAISWYHFRNAVCSFKAALLWATILTGNLRSQTHNTTNKTYVKIIRSSSSSRAYMSLLKIADHCPYIHASASTTLNNVRLSGVTTNVIRNTQARNAYIYCTRMKILIYINRSIL